MSVRRIASGASVVLGVAAGAACVPSDPALVHDLAVRLTPEGDIEVLPCTDNELEDLRFLAVRDPGTEAREDEVVWWIEWDPSATVDSVVLGDLPPEADEREPWRPELLADQPDSVFTLLMEQSNGNERATSFELAELQDGAVMFDGELMTAASFAESDAAEDCGG